MENATEKRGPGKPRKNFTKTVKFRVDGNMLLPLGRGKPNKAATIVTREVPYNWVRGPIAA
jgi:hypothetical protein